ncbi:MAG TPA: sensor histidine kinase, partial [Anaerolineaceae bacterium]
AQHSCAHPGYPMRELLTPPKFPDEQSSQRARLLYLLVEIMIAATTLAQGIYLVLDPVHASRYWLVLGVIDGSGLVMLYLTRRGHTYAMSVALIVIAWLVTTVLAVTDGGIRAPEIAASFMIVFAAGVILDERAGILLGLTCILTGLALVAAETSGSLPASAVRQTSFSIWLTYSVFIAIIVGIQYIATRTIHENFYRAQQELAERHRLEAEQIQAQIQFELHRLLIRHQESERLKIARELHDGPIQDLVADILALQGVIDSSSTGEGREVLEAIKLDLQGQIANLRDYAGELRPPALVKFGFESALHSHLEGFQEKNPDYSIKLEVENENRPLPEDIRLALFRIYQEAMVNITKHARASEISIRFCSSQSETRLEIQDNGIGFQPPDTWVDLAREGHLGVVGIRERAEAVGGHVEILSRPGGGTTLRVVVPLEKENGAQPPQPG